MTTNWLSRNPFGGGGTITSLPELGERMLSWHKGQNDPVYAVGSFYVSGQEYPDPEVVDDSIYILDSVLDGHERMLRGEPVMVRRFGKMVDLRKFAGYSDKDLQESIEDLEEILSGLERAKQGDL